MSLLYNKLEKALVHPVGSSTSKIVTTSTLKGKIAA